ncbi:MAG: type II secretion system F family protein [Alphaproteobacteria bacterium]|nr:type II secretion system F family protein [Alphaproteobacteria bacterium]
MTDTDRLAPQVGSTSGRRPNRRYIRQFLRQIASLLGAGISVDRAMDLLSRQHDAPAIAMISGRMARRIRQGAALSDTMVAEGKMFDALDISVVTAAETSGRLAEATARLADYHERRDAVADRIRAALIYPMILVLAAALAVTMLFLVVVPGIAPLLAGADSDLPTATRAVLAISDFLRSHGWTIPAILLALLLASALPGGRRTRDRLGLTLPLIAASGRTSKPNAGNAGSASCSPMAFRCRAPFKSPPTVSRTGP